MMTDEHSTQIATKDNKVVRRKMGALVWMAYLFPIIVGLTMGGFVSFQELGRPLVFEAMGFLVGAALATFLSSIAAGFVLYHADKKAGGHLGGYFSPLECGLYGMFFGLVYTATLRPQVFGEEIWWSLIGLIWIVLFLCSGARAGLHITLLNIVRWVAYNAMYYIFSQGILIVVRVIVG